MIRPRPWTRTRHARRKPTRCRNATRLRHLRFEPLEPLIMLSTSPWSGSFEPALPAGSLVYESRETETIDAAEAVDSYTVDVNANQTITLVAETNAPLDLALTLKGPSAVNGPAARRGWRRRGRR